MTGNISLREQEHYRGYIVAGVPLDKAIRYAREDAAAESTEGQENR